MRTKVIFLALAMLLSTVACEKDKNLPLDQVPNRAITKLYTLYMTAEDPKWELVYNQYYATFSYEGKTSIAKFTYSGDWLITLTPLAYSDIPVEIITSLEESNFRNWIIKDQNKEHTPINGELYRLLMYDDARERPLYFTADGELVVKSL